MPVRIIPMRLSNPSRSLNEPAQAGLTKSTTEGEIYGSSVL